MEKSVVKIQGMLRRLQADIYKVKITFKSHVLSVFFLFYWFLTLHQAMYFKFKKHEIPMSTASQYDRMYRVHPNTCYFRTHVFWQISTSSLPIYIRLARQVLKSKSYSFCCLHIPTRVKCHFSQALKAFPNNGKTLLCLFYKQKAATRTIVYPHTQKKISP